MALGPGASIGVAPKKKNTLTATTKDNYKKVAEEIMKRVKDGKA